jgi:hypothetical protein
MTPSDRFSAPASGFTFVAPTRDACEGDACLLPGASDDAGESASLLRGDVRDRRAEG